MNTPRLALSLAVATAIAARPAHPDAQHGRAASPAPAPALEAAHRLSSSVALRAEPTPLRDVAREAIDAGAARTGQVKSDRAAPFMDWAFAGVPFTPRSVLGTPGRF
jgi:hypothetical protein